MILSNHEIMGLNAILEVAIYKSHDEDDGDPAYHEVRVIEIPSFADADIQSNVYTSLAAQGFIQFSGTEDEIGNEILEYVCITQPGIDALKLEVGVH